MSTKKIKYGTKEAERDYGPLTFAKSLEAHRLGEEISQKEFSQILGISQQSLCDLEKGRKIPSPERAALIAKKIGEPAGFWIKVALQDLLREYDLNYEINLIETRKLKRA